jgi:hypothetical protein
LSQALLPQEIASGRLLARYDVDTEPCSSSNQDAPSASHEPAPHSWRPGNNPGCQVWITKPFGFRVCWPYGNRVWRKTAAALRSGGAEEKVLCSSGIYNGVSEASSVKSKGANIGHPTRETTEENPEQEEDSEQRRRKKSFQ